MKKEILEFTETEEKILEAAKKVFVNKGYDGARMQQIADEAGINKSLLHYYFRSKDKLFEAVFQETLLRIGPMVLSFVNEPIPLEVKIWKFVDDYIEIIKNKPISKIVHENSSHRSNLSSQRRNLTLQYCFVSKLG